MRAPSRYCLPHWTGPAATPVQVVSDYYFELGAGEFCQESIGIQVWQSDFRVVYEPTGQITAGKNTYFITGYASGPPAPMPCVVPWYPVEYPSTRIPTSSLAMPVVPRPLCPSLLRPDPLPPQYPLHPGGRPACIWFGLPVVNPRTRRCRRLLTHGTHRTREPGQAHNKYP